MVTPEVRGHLPPRDVGLGDAQHLHGRVVQLDEHPVVDLQQTEELEHGAHLRIRGSMGKGRAFFLTRVIGVRATTMHASLVPMCFGAAQVW